MKRLTKETRFVGLPVSSGLAKGPVCLLTENRHQALPMHRSPGIGPDVEKARLQHAAEEVAERLDALGKDVAERIGPAEAQIFAAQKTILQDKHLMDEMIAAIETQDLNAEAAVSSVLDVYEDRLLQLDSQHIRERASDIGEIKRRLLDVLGNMNPSLQCEGLAHCQKGRDRIIVAVELTPSLTVELTAGRPKAFVTERGGLTSHAAILARALGIPAVSGLKGIHSLLSCGTELLVNGETGEVIVWPSERTLRQMGVQDRAASRAEPAVAPVAGLKVMASISRSADAAQAAAMQAEGVGLYRTEFEFLAAGRVLTEHEQARRYEEVLEAMGNRPVYFRLLDIGADKAGHFLDVPQERNPQLGCRGARLLLQRPDLLEPQARALARAAASTTIHVLYPMIIDRDQFLALRDRFLEALGPIRTGQIRHGVMFEVPSACLQAHELLEAADFASIGTNDLIQYLFAVDRNSPLVAYDYKPDRPALWSLMGRIASAARQLGRPLSVCGELAADPANVPRLIALGIDAVSVSARLIPPVRQAAQRFFGINP